MREAFPRLTPRGVGRRQLAGLVAHPASSGRRVLHSGGVATEPDEAETLLSIQSVQQSSMFILEHGKRDMSR